MRRQRKNDHRIIRGALRTFSLTPAGLPEKDEKGYICLMRKQIFGLCFIGVLLWACAGNAGVVKSEGEERTGENQNTNKNLPLDTSSITSIKDTIWYLTDVRGADEAIRIDRQNKEPVRDYFTIQFKNEAVYGKAAPNRYSAPYLRLKGNEIKLNNMISTLMASEIASARGFSEQDYFRLLQGVYRWKQAGDELYLYAKNEDGNEIILVFNKE